MCYTCTSMRQYDAISDDAHQMNHVNWIGESDELNLATCMHDVTNVVCEEGNQHITELFTVSCFDLWMTIYPSAAIVRASVHIIFTSLTDWARGAPKAQNE